MHRIKLTGSMTCTEAFIDAMNPLTKFCSEAKRVTRYRAKLIRKTRQIAALLASGQTYMAKQTAAELGRM